MTLPPLARDGAIAALLVLAFLAIALPGLGRPAFVVFDEFHHVHAALELSAGRLPAENSHPPLPRVLMAATMRATGTAVEPAGRAWDIHAPWPEAFPVATARAWRLPSLVAGTAAVGLLFALGRALGLAPPFAALAAGLLALDGCFLVHSRIGMTNVFEVAFVVAAALGAARGVATARPGWLWAAGGALGLALASRSTGGAALLLIGAWAAWRLRAAPRLLGHLAAAFTILPAALYVASYAPLVALGPAPGAADLLDGRAWAAFFVRAQAGMVMDHTANMEGLRHLFASPWWSWPLELRPALYALQPEGDGRFRAIWAIGNPVVWWASVPALVAAALAARRGRAELALPAALGLGMWLVWIVVPQPMAFMHYYLTVIPFAALAIAATLEAWWRGAALRPGGPPLLEPAAGRAATALVVVAAAAWLAYYRPVLVWEPLPVAGLHARQWSGPAWP